MRHTVLWVAILALMVPVAVFASGATEVADTPEEQVDLVWYYRGFQTEDQEVINEAVNEYLARVLPNTTVQMNPLSGAEIDQRMNLIIQSGEYFDLAFTASWSNNYYQNVGRGAFRALDDLLPTYGPNILDVVEPQLWDGVKVNGKIYAIPNLQQATNRASVHLRADLLSQPAYSGFDADSVTTMEDLSDYLALIAANSPEVAYPFEAGSVQGQGSWPSLAPYYRLDFLGGNNNVPAVSYDDETVTAVNRFKTEEFEQFVYLMRDWYEKGYIGRDAMTIRDYQPMRRAGQVGLIVGSPNWAPGGEAQYRSRFNYDSKNVILSPLYLTTSGATATLTGVSDWSDNPERAVQFVDRLMSDEELYNMIAFGLEGEHYTMEGENRIAPMSDAKYRSANWAFGNTYLRYLVPGLSEEDEAGRESLNSQGEVMASYGFAFDTAPVEAELSQSVSVMDEFVPALVTGSADPAQLLPEFLDKLDAAGAQRIVDEANRQLREWAGAR